MLQYCYQTNWIDLKTITCKVDCIIVNYVFGRVDFREDLKKKKKKKKTEEKLFGECLVRRGRGKKTQ